jgi:hypothetical protein
MDLSEEPEEQEMPQDGDGPRSRAASDDSDGEMMARDPVSFAIQSGNQGGSKMGVRMSTLHPPVSA